jgi:hypothetical protein
VQLTDGRSVGQSVSQSVSQSWSRAPWGTHDHILVVVKTVVDLFVMGRPPCQEDGSVM